MLKIPEPVKKTAVKLNVQESTSKELDVYVRYVQTKHPHATKDMVVEAMINSTIPRTGSEAKAYREFKKGL